MQYETAIRHGGWWAAAYVVAVIGPALLSGYRSIVSFGVLNLVGLVVVAVLLAKEFASVWCVYAALSSILVLVHLRRRRRLPDPHRLHGHRQDPGRGRCPMRSRRSSRGGAGTHRSLEPARLRPAPTTITAPVTRSLATARRMAGSEP